MAAIGAKIQLEGEAEYRRNLKEITSALGAYDAQLKLVETQSASNTDKTASLSKESELLKTKADVLTEKLRIQEKQYEKVVQATGKTSEKAYKLQADMARTSTEYEKNSQKLAENTEKLEENSNTSEKASKGVKSFGDTSKESFNTAKLAAYECAKAIAEKLITSIKDLCTSSAMAVEELSRLSAETGLTAQELQQLDYAAIYTNVSVETITEAMNELKLKLSEAVNDGASPAAQSFKELGVSLYSGVGQVRDSREVFEEIIRKLGDTCNESDRVRLSQELLGGEANKLNGIMGQDGVNALRAYCNEAQNAGLVMSNSQMNNLQNLNNEYERAQKEIDAVKAEIAAELAPTLTELGKKFAEVLRELKPFITDGLKWLLEHIGDIAKGVMYFVGGLIALKIVSTLINIMQSFNTTMAATNATMMSNPATYIALAIAAAAVVIALALEHWASAAERSAIVAGDLGNNISRGMEDAIDSAKSLGNTLDRVVDSIDWKNIQSKFKAYFTVIGKNSADEFMNAFKRGIADIGKEIEKKIPSSLNLQTVDVNYTTYQPMLNSVRDVSYVNNQSWNSQAQMAFIEKMTNSLKSVLDTKSGKIPTVPGTTQSVEVALVVSGKTLATVIWDPLMKVAKQKGVELINKKEDRI